MHGRLKVRTPEEQKEAEQKEREKKLTAFKSMWSDIVAKRNQSDHSCETLQNVELLLTRCSDLYTLWNYRREILLDHFKKSQSAAETDGICKYELSFTESCLTKDPKSYSTWHHRCWVLGQMVEPNWGRELVLCDKALMMDERNFHVWDHRREVVKRGRISLEKELECSTKLIQRNFSNYSSWHYRTTLLPRLFPEKIPEQQITDELKLVLDAVFMDPNDQSAWFYSQFLVDQIKKGGYENVFAQLIDSIKELCELEPENEWVLHASVKLLLLRGAKMTDKDKKFVEDALEKLGTVDPLRLGYYKSLKVQFDKS